MAGKPKHRVDTKEHDGQVSEVLIWFGDQCIFHWRRISDTQAGMDIYLIPHQHIDIESEGELRAHKPPQNSLRKSPRHANIKSEESGV